MFFAHLFATNIFQHGSLKRTKYHKIPRKTHHRNAPTSKACKTTPSETGHTFEIHNLYMVSKAAKREPKCKLEWNLWAPRISKPKGTRCSRWGGVPKKIEDPRKCTYFGPKVPKNLSKWVP